MSTSQLTGTSTPQPLANIGRPVAARVVAVVGAAAFLFALTALHLIKREFDPSWRYVSEYQIGLHGWLMSTAFLTLAASCIATFIVLRGQLSTRSGRLGRTLLLVTAFGLTLGGLFTMDPITATKAELTTHGKIHGFGAMIGMPSFLIAVILIRRSLRTSSPAGLGRLTQATRFVVGTVVVFFASMIITAGGPAGPSNPIGWQNRALMVAYAGWLIIAATLELTPSPAKR